MPATPQAPKASTGNVVAAVAQLAQRHAKAGNHTPYTPAQWGTLAGYPGAKASNLRATIARNMGLGVTRKGRYPAVTPTQLLQLLGYGQAHAKAATPQAKGTQATKAGAVYAKARKASAAPAAKASAAKASTPAPTPAAAS